MLTKCILGQKIKNPPNLRRYILFKNYNPNATLLKHSVWKEKQIYESLKTFIEENPEYINVLPKNVFNKTFFQHDKSFWKEI